MYSIASNPCDYDMGDYDCDDEAMCVRIMVIIGAMMIAMIESRMRTRDTILEENMRELLNTTLMVKIERKKALVEAPMMMREHVRGHMMAPLMKPEHVTLPTPKMDKVRYNTV
ncbi:hypothetical protein RDI58_026915 [Solanum bulbocastanum]|uniref:Uncharacterized protein n=1 Tax=Solanum bulbocastanum TaxID=147425 RepID=A0AAN8Y1K8_SOLBU